MPDATDLETPNGTKEGLATRARRLFGKDNTADAGQTPSGRLADLERTQEAQPLTRNEAQHPDNNIPDLAVAELPGQERADLSTELAAIGDAIQQQREPIDPELEEALFVDSQQYAPNASLSYQTPNPGATAQDRARLALETLALELGAEGSISPEGTPVLTGEKAADLKSLIEAQLAANEEAITKALKAKTLAQQEAESQGEQQTGRSSPYTPMTDEEIAIAAAKDLQLFNSKEEEPLTAEEKAAVDQDIKTWRDSHGLPEPKEPIAVRLTEDQTRLLVRNEYPDNVQAQNQALYEITNTDSTVSVLKDTVQLDYSEDENTFFASLEKEEKPALDQKLTQLQAEQDRRRQPPPQERERGRQRDRSKDYERD